jgi:hypothetical protein
LLGILPSAQDPFRTYGSVENGRMTPPQNPYGQNQPINFTPGGEWGGGGINTGPSRPPWQETSGGGGNPWLERGGFTGGNLPGMPQNSMGDGGGGTGYFNPSPQLMNSGGSQMGGRRMHGGFGSMYGNSF